MYRKVFALDFDGVICDSARETSTIAYQVAMELINESIPPIPSDQFHQNFIQFRYLIETGYESIFLALLILNNSHKSVLLNEFKQSVFNLMQSYHLNSEDCINLFSIQRSKFFQNDPQGWIAMQPFYPGIIPALQYVMTTPNLLAIVSTKEKQFILTLLKANGIPLAENMIFGLKEGKKSAVLLRLSALVSTRNMEFHFIDDRLDTLMSLIEMNDLNQWNLYWAKWGYVSPIPSSPSHSTQRIISLSHAQFISLLTTG